MSEMRRGLYSVIPARVMDDCALRPNAKLLYGELSSLAQAEGYCWASNAYLAERLNVAAKTAEALLKQLKERGHITLEVVRDKSTKEVIQRKIWICGPPGSCIPSPIEGDPPLKNEGTSPQNIGDPPLKNEEIIIQDNNTSNITPQSPPEGGGPGRKKRKQKSEPTWQPERFRGFWAAYPRDENRAKAVEQWDALPRDKSLMDKHGGDEDGLLREIALGLKRHLECPDWKEGRGIPHAFRWLRDRRWTEKIKPLPASASAAPPEPPKPLPHRTEIINGEEVIIYDG